MKHILIKITYLTCFFYSANNYNTTKDPLPTQTIHQLLALNGTLDALFFTPDEAPQVKALLLELINHEAESIRAALFRLTDKPIVDALISAHTRGVVVELVIDSGALDTKNYSKVSLAIRSGIPVYEYQNIGLIGHEHTNSRYKTIMHHKTFIFANTLGGSVVFFGSLNPTYAGFHGNEEAVQIRNNLTIVTGFARHFEKLKKRSNQLPLDYTRKKTKKQLRITQN